MRVFITGGTGLIGHRLVDDLRKRGDEAVVLTRSAEKARRSLPDTAIVQGDPTAPGDWQAAVDGCDAVIHLAGHNVFSDRWNDEVRRKIRESRVLGTRNVVAALEKAPRRPRVLVQGSAIGYYGPRGDEVLTESSTPGDDFLARVCIDWEAAARPAEALGVRVPVMRIGIVLAEGEGALGMMTPLFKFAPGAPVGGSLVGRGRQWMSWIHLDDIAGLILRALDDDRAAGPINGTAPNPVRNAEFSRILSRVLRTPSTPWRFFIPIGPPDALLKVALGDVAEVVTTGQRVHPEAARALGYSFRFPDLEPALRDVFSRPRASARTA